MYHYKIITQTINLYNIIYQTIKFYKAAYKILYLTIYFVFKRSRSICHIIQGHF